MFSPIYLCTPTNIESWSALIFTPIFVKIHLHCFNSFLFIWGCFFFFDSAHLSTRILHLPQLVHHGGRVGLTGDLFHLVGVDTHEGIVGLFLPDCEFPLGLLILVGEPRELVQGPVVGQHLFQKLDVGFGVLVARVDPGVVGQGGQDLVEGPVHLGPGTLEELAAAADEERVPGEDDPLVRGLVLHEPTDAVLGVAGGVEGRDPDVLADGKGRVVRRGFGHPLAVPAADDGQGARRKRREDFGVATRVVPVVVGVHYRRQVEGLGLLGQDRGDSVSGEKTQNCIVSILSRVSPYLWIRIYVLAQRHTTKDRLCLRMYFCAAQGNRDS